MAWQLRFDFAVPTEHRSVLWRSFVWIVPFKLVMLSLFRQFSGLLTFFGVRDLFRVFGAIAVSAVVVFLSRYLFETGSGYTPTRGVIFIDFVLSFMGLAGLRLFLRIYRERAAQGEQDSRLSLSRVAIIGASHFGANLARDLFTRKGLGMKPVYFFDDNPNKWQSRIHDVQVVGKPEMLLDDRFRDSIDKVIIALPTASGKRIREVVKLAQEAGKKCATVPSLEELTTGRVKVSQLRNVQIQDLLRREQIELETENIAQLICDKVVMVTGAGGSIGSELCRQIANYNTRRLLLVEQCEVQLFTIEQELVERGFESMLVPLVSDVLDMTRMESIFQRFKPDLVFHAAAHKHVSLMEQQPAEAFRNNTLGTVNIADMAVRHAVSHFVLVSTDKAINPTSVMGVTKRLAEIFLQSLHAASHTPTKFMAVRFGNVLGSSGSVVPILEKQIDEGGPVTITHPEVTRYFMTIPEAVGLILQAASQGKGGEIFVLDMGSPIKIVDLAHQLIELHGHNPGTDIEIEFIGLKPGEKLFEEFSHMQENLEKTDHSEILRFVSNPVKLAEIRRQIQEIEDSLHHLEPDQIKLKFKKVIPEYQPYLS